MVIRARFIANVIHGKHFRILSYSFTRLSRDREASKEQSSPLEGSAAQVLSALRGSQVVHFLRSSTLVPSATVAKAADKPDEQIPNDEYEAWVAKDQQILNYLLSSLSQDIRIEVATLPTTATVWEAIEAMFASQSRARVIKTHMALATAQKGTSTIAEYFSKMRSLADDMASAGKLLEDEEIASYILAGLDIECNPVVSAISARTDPISLGELFIQLSSFE